MLLLCAITYSQVKIKYDKEKFYINRINFSMYPALDQVVSYKTNYQVDPDLKAEFLELKKKFFKINGYIEDPKDGQLQLGITINKPSLHNIKVDSTYNKTDFKWKFFITTEYNVKIIADVTLRAKLIHTELFNEIKEVRIKGEYDSKKNADYAAKVNEEFIRTEALGTTNVVPNKAIELVLANAMYNIQARLNYKLGYTKTEEKIKFEFIKSTTHPDFKIFNDFQNEIKTQVEAITFEKGLDEPKIMPHLKNLESLIDKYQPSEQNQEIRFIILNNLATVYYLLEKKEETLKYSKLLIENNQQISRGKNIIEDIQRLVLEPNKIRAHNNRYKELEKLNYKIEEDIENERLAFFEGIEQEALDWEAEKESRTKWINKNILYQRSMLDSIAYQNNPEILQKIVHYYGGSQALKNIQKLHLVSELNFEDSNVPVSDEQWQTDNKYLLKKRMPELYYEIINGPESWRLHNQLSNKTWQKMSSSEYWSTISNMDPIYLLTGLRLDIWNQLDLQQDEYVNNKLCYHLEHIEKVIDYKNRALPKTEYHFYIDKESHQIVWIEKTEYVEGKKSSFESKKFEDYQPQSDLNNGMIAQKIVSRYEDFYGENNFETTLKQIEINGSFSSRIFMKEVYAGGFR